MSDDLRVLYFGTYREAGHYLWTTDGQHHYVNDPEWKELEKAFPAGLDGKHNPTIEREGEALLWRQNGWTAVAFANRTDDTRPGSNSTFFFQTEKIESVAEAWQLAQAAFPHVTERFAFEVRMAPEDNRTPRVTASKVGRRG